MYAMPANNHYKALQFHHQQNKNADISFIIRIPLNDNKIIMRIEGNKINKCSLKETKQHLHMKQQEN